MLSKALLVLSMSVLPHLASNQCPCVYNVRHQFAGNLSLYRRDCGNSSDSAYSLPTGHLGVLQDRHIPLYSMHSLSCGSNFPLPFTSCIATLVFCSYKSSAPYKPLAQLTICSTQVLFLLAQDFRENDQEIPHSQTADQSTAP